jgi:hypothetical protein
VRTEAVSPAAEPMDSASVRANMCQGCWFTRKEEQRAYLKLLRAEDFLVMLRRRQGERLAAWLDAAEAGAGDELKRFQANCGRIGTPCGPG